VDHVEKAKCLERFDKPRKPGRKSVRAAPLSRDRALEPQIRGKDAAQARLVEDRRAVLPAVVLGEHELSCLVVRLGLTSCLSALSHTRDEAHECLPDLVR
jgi:hypothetical protein